MPQTCPNCQNSNPDVATYCFFDGMMLKAGAAPANKLASPFVFPSGRNCSTYDEMVQGCQEEWTAARDMLKEGVFEGFFKSVGRMDLVNAAKEGQSNADPDIGLTQMLQSLPSSVELSGPKLDINPRRLQLGKVMAGQTRKIPFKVLNRGQGILQGTLSITEGDEWLKLGADSGGQANVKTSKDQQIPLTADTRGLAAGEPYAAKLRIITNGGVEEVPIRIEVGSHPFPKAPFNGAKSPRDMAVKMKNNPKAASALLTTGELPKWFSSNGWTYPISGTPAPGVAGVQQFFESMGLAKPPGVKLSHPQIRLTCKVPDRPRFNVLLVASSKKYVYGNVRCDAPWLNILTPAVSGPQKAGIAFAIDPRHLPSGKVAQTTVQIIANGNQKLNLQVQVDINRPADTPIVRLVRPMAVMAISFLLLRLLLAPIVDFYARPAAVKGAALKAVSDKRNESILTQNKNIEKQNAKIEDADKKKKLLALHPPPIDESSAVHNNAGWLSLPWLAVLIGQQNAIPADFFGADETNKANRIVNEENFRDFFVQGFVGRVILFTWWLGALLGAIILFRKNGFLDGIWGLFSGSVLGIIVGASAACLLLIGDLMPFFAWSIVFGGSTTGFVHLVVWSLMAVVWWLAVGIGLGFVLLILGPIGKIILTPFQDAFGGFFRLCGLRGLASLFASS